MKKTSKTVRAAILLLVLCMISTAMLGGTFAKYTSEYAGQDTALIAKWEVTPIVASASDGTTVLGTDTLDLFSHLYDANMLQKITVGGVDEYIIAPGVEGDFFINIANTSDVAAKITFEFDEDDGTAVGVPIEYSLNDTDDWGTLAELKADLEALPADASNDAMANVTETDGTVSATVHWRWAFEQDTAAPEVGDTADTLIGVTSNTNYDGGNRSTYILKITATATQIEPDTL
jgi:hypothetical protein